MTKLQKQFITPSILVLAREDAEIIDLVQDGQDRYYLQRAAGRGK